MFSSRWDDDAAHMYLLTLLRQSSLPNRTQKSVTGRVAVCLPAQFEADDVNCMAIVISHWSLDLLHRQQKKIDEQQYTRRPFFWQNKSLEQKETLLHWQYNQSAIALGCFPFVINWNLAMRCLAYSGLRLLRNTGARCNDRLQNVISNL